MDYIELPGVPARCSRLGIGTRVPASLSSSAVEAQLEVVRHALSLGVTCLHTSPAFESVPGEAIGRVLAGCRDDVVLVSHLLPGRAAAGRLEAHLREAVDQELLRLGVEHLDVVQVLPWNMGVALVDLPEILQSIVASGRVRTFGLNCPMPTEVAQGSWLRETRGLDALVAVQEGYSLLHRIAEKAILDGAELAGMHFFAASPLAGGVLSGRFRTPEARGMWATRTPEHPAWERVAAVAARLTDMAVDAGMSLAQLSLAWVLQQPQVSGAFAFVRTPEQVDGLVAASNLALDHDAMAVIDSIAPPENSMLSEALAAMAK